MLGSSGVFLLGKRGWVVTARRAHPRARRGHSEFALPLPPSRTILHEECGRSEILPPFLSYLTAVRRTPLRLVETVAHLSCGFFEHGLNSEGVGFRAHSKKRGERESQPPPVLPLPSHLSRLARRDVPRYRFWWHG